jgi:aspartate-semialdehyde dehydrogenase
MVDMNVAVLGATGAVGREMIRTLEERAFPADTVVALASARSEGMSLPFQGGELTVRAVTAEEFRGVDVALFSAGAATAKEWAPPAVHAGAVVVDNSSAFRMDPKVPWWSRRSTPEPSVPIGGSWPTRTAPRSPR